MSQLLLITDKDLNEVEEDLRKRNLQVILIMPRWVKKEEDLNNDEDKKD